MPPRHGQLSLHDNPAKQARQALEYQAQLDRYKTRARGNNQGWNKVRSGGVKVWQLVEGGKYRIFMERPVADKELSFKKPGICIPQVA